MDRRILICLIVMALSLPLPVNAASPQPREIRPLASVDVLIPSHNYYIVSLTGLVEGDDISIDIQETSGNTISWIWIMDNGTYTYWTEHHHLITTIMPARIYQNEWDLTATFSVPTSGTWYVLFYNDRATSIQIEGSVVSVSQQARGNLFIIIIIVSILVFICVCYTCLKRQRDKDKKKLPQPHPTPQQKESVGFCPYCGTPKHLFDAKFCSKCGRAFSGPDLG